MFAQPVLDMPIIPLAVLYTAVSVLTVVGYRAWIARRDSPAVRAVAAQPLLRDPYAVAYLRGGAVDAVRTAIFALLERGALVKAGPMLVRARRVDAFGMRPLERTVLERYTSPHMLGTVLHDTAFLNDATADHARSLRTAGLLDRQGPMDRTVYMVLTALLITLAVVAAWMSAALAPLPVRGAGLEGLPVEAAACFPMAAAACALLKPARRRLTRYGRIALADVTQQHAWRIDVGTGEHGGTEDAVWLAAVLGVAALPVDRFPLAARALPQRVEPAVLYRNTRSSRPRTPPRRFSGVSNTTLNSLR